MFNSITYGKVIINKVKDSKNPFELNIGTDSQNHRKTKIVKVISLHEKGCGGIFFYKVEYVKRIQDLRSKIYKETQLSLDLAKELTLALFDNDLDPHVTIHVDIGRRGKTNMVINEIVGWITAEGFNCKIKPEAYTASTIADKISK